LCAESAAGSRQPQRNRLGAESALADALGVPESSPTAASQSVRTSLV
jgi:hypothetical protein